MVLPNSDLIFNKIDECDTITIFGHVRPDGDAYGSAMGLKLAIDMFYSGKKTFAVVDDTWGVPTRLPKATKPNSLPIETIKDSLAITVDTPTVARLGDPRAINAKYLIKIDHHPLVEHFGDAEFVDDSKCANALIIADILYSRFPVISPDAAECLLLGILTDSGNLRFTTEADAFNKAGRLISNGANIKEVYDTIYASSLSNLRLKNKMLSQLKTKGKVAYCIFDLPWLKSLGQKADDIAPHVNLIGFTSECPLWAFFAQYPDGSYRAEFRCNGDYDVSAIAALLGGGGHRQASGATLANRQEVLKAIDLLAVAKPSPEDQD